MNGLWPVRNTQPSASTAWLKCYIENHSFFQQFNAASAHLKGKVIGVLVTVYKDRTFSFELKSPPASVMLKDAVKAEKGSGEPNKNNIGKVTMAQCIAIAKEKGKDLNAFDEAHAGRIIAGTARSMGITVEG